MQPARSSSMAIGAPPALSRKQSPFIDYGSVSVSRGSMEVQEIVQQADNWFSAPASIQPLIQQGKRFCQLLDNRYSPLHSMSVERRLCALVNSGLDAGFDPELAEDGTGGAYFLCDANETSVAVFKPSDEEPYTPNNPRGFMSPSPRSPFLLHSHMARASTWSARTQTGLLPSRPSPLLFHSSGEPQEALNEPITNAEPLSKQMRSGIPGGSAACREVAAYLLDYNNYAGVPPTMLAVMNHEAFHCSEEDVIATRYRTKKFKIGSLQAFVKHSYCAEDLPMRTIRRFPVSEVHKLAILDIRLCNSDRHGGNILVRESPTDPGSIDDETTSFGQDGMFALEDFASKRTSFRMDDDDDLSFSSSSASSSSGLSGGALSDDEDSDRQRKLVASFENLVLSSSSSIGTSPATSTPRRLSTDSVTSLRSSQSNMLRPFSVSLSVGAAEGASNEIALIPIDHGYVLPENMSETYFEWYTWPQARQPFDDDCKKYIANLDWKKDVAQLKKFGNVFTEDCLQVLRTTTVFLQLAVRHNLTPYDIATMMCRERLQEPSVIESLCLEARSLLLKESDDDGVVAAARAELDRALPLAPEMGLFAANAAQNIAAKQSEDANELYFAVLHQLMQKKMKNMKLENLPVKKPQYNDTFLGAESHTNTTIHNKANKLTQQSSPSDELVSPIEDHDDALFAFEMSS